MLAAIIHAPLSSTALAETLQGPARSEAINSLDTLQKFAYQRIESALSRAEAIGKPLSLKETAELLDEYEMGYQILRSVYAGESAIIHETDSAKLHDLQGFDYRMHTLFKTAKKASVGDEGNAEKWQTLDSGLNSVIGRQVKPAFESALRNIRWNTKAERDDLLELARANYFHATADLLEEKLIEVMDPAMAEVVAEKYRALLPTMYGRDFYSYFVRPRYTERRNSNEPQFFQRLRELGKLPPISARLSGLVRFSSSDDTYKENISDFYDRVENRNSGLKLTVENYFHPDFQLPASDAEYLFQLMADSEQRENTFGLEAMEDMAHDLESNPAVYKNGRRMAAIYAKLFEIHPKRTRALINKRMKDGDLFYSELTAMYYALNKIGYKNFPADFPLTLARQFADSPYPKKDMFLTYLYSETQNKEIAYLLTTPDRDKLSADALQGIDRFLEKIVAGNDAELKCELSIDSPFSDSDKEELGRMDDRDMGRASEIFMTERGDPDSAFRIVLQQSLISQCPEIELARKLTANSSQINIKDIKSEARGDIRLDRTISATVVVSGD